jgi:putative endonuclease
MSNKTLGDFGEEVAADRLRAKGYRILERNWRTSTGEIDLVAVHDGVVVFIEVKTRTSDIFGSPEEAITHKKKEMMVSAAQWYLEEKNLSDINWRIDMVAVVCDRRGKVSRFDHYEDVITGL